MDTKTHYADDDTLAYIDHLERELAEAKAERDENGRLADNAQDGWRKSLEERQKLASYAEQLRAAVRAYLDAASDEDDFATLSELEALTAKGPEGEIIK